jgi:high-affinity iron transporter
MKRSLFLIVLWIGLCAVCSVRAGSTPAADGEAVRQALFAAQSALLRPSTASEAAADLSEAQALYATALRPTLAEARAQVDVLDQAFAQAASAIAQGDSITLAAARGQIWTGILHGSMQVALAAVAQADLDTARAWLALREFRASTRFSRPNANATLALNDPTLNNDARAAAIQADLLDTYQAQLNATLLAAEQAQTRGFRLRWAEETALANGYFAILAPAYQQQHPEQTAAVNAAFAALVRAAVAGDAAGYAAASAELMPLLQGFRAAPLSEAELARRAGQLTRFLALVAVEYGRGVRDGIVTNDIEIQEARTFLSGSQAAFADVEATLLGFNPANTARVAELLAQIQSQINETAAPSALQANVDEAGRLLSATLPAAWLTLNTASDVDVISSVLDQVVVAAQQGQYMQAESARLEAYALLELGIEQKLRGFAPERAAQIESLFWGGDGQQRGLADLIAAQAELSSIKAAVANLKTALRDAQIFLDANNTAPAAVAGNAAIIVFREGLEAVLILASLLASLRTAEEARFRRPLVVGSLLALVATAITWVLAHMLLNVLLPFGERLEAIVSLVAIAVLLVIMNWFFHKVYWTGWLANFHAQKRALLGGALQITINQTVGLVLLGFTSVYREGFETVLFLQSLVLEAGIGTVLLGVALGSVGVAIIGVVMFALQVRLPYKNMLIVTGVLIGIVLMTMVGNTIHVMQAVGWMPITPISSVFVPYWLGQWFGIYATWQTLGGQVLAAVYVIGSYYLAERQNTGARRGLSTASPK